MNDRFHISTDKSKLDLAIIHNFLKSSRWAENIPLQIVKKSIENSLCFGVYEGNKQIGFGRVITDYATFAYLSDVFIVESFRGLGLGKWLVEYILEYAELQGLRRWLLGTIDAHGLYRQYGFQMAKPERYMEINVPNIYRK